MSRVLQAATDQITQNYNSLTHKGIDLVKYKNKTANIIAHSDGVVIETKTGQKRDINTKGMATYGNYVKIRHNNGYYTFYAHLKDVKVSKNAIVKRGDVIGVMGNSGNTTNTHLHFEVRNKQDRRINPTKYLDADLPNNPDNLSVIYQVYDNKKQIWLPNVKNDTDYAGNIGNAISALYMNLTVGDIKYRVHELNKTWLPTVTNREDYAGNIGKVIDGIQISSINTKLSYRVHLLNGRWLSWVSKWDDTNDGYAGILGRSIDAVQVKILED